MTGDDRDALWAWLQTPSGESDSGRWTQVLSALDFRDPPAAARPPRRSGGCARAQS